MRPKQLVSKAELRLWRLIYTCLELQNLWWLYLIGYIVCLHEKEAFYAYNLFLFRFCIWHKYLVVEYIQVLT